MIKQFLGRSRRYVLNRVNSPALVLLYHRVTDPGSDPQLLSVSPENFYEQVNLLRTKYALLEVEEFFQLLKNKKKFPKNACILTFDDGYADNLLEALPILETLKSQALFYITTCYLGTARELWWDELERIILEPTQLPPAIDLEIHGKTYRFTVATSAERWNSYHALHPLLKYLPPKQRDEKVDQLRQMAKLPVNGRPSHRMLTVNELKQLGNSSAAIIGAHTLNHPALSVLPYEQQLEELRQSKTFLENALSKTVDHFSYPYGSKRDYNSDSIRACREAGFKMVCSNFYNQVHSWTDLYQIPRALVRNWDKPTFDKFITSSFTC